MGEWGADRVGVRLSPRSSFNDMSDSDPAATFGHAAAALDRFGLAYLHVVENLDSHPIGEGRTGERVTPVIRERFSGPLMVNDGHDRETAEEALASGRADLVSFGRLFLANPDLPERFRRGAELNEPDPDTFYGGGEEGYTDYPSLDQT